MAFLSFLRKWCISSSPTIAIPAGISGSGSVSAACCIDFKTAGVVTLLKEEHENSASRIFSNDRDCLVPHVHSRRTKGSVCLCRNEMALDVESVVGGCVS
jgi:hypothetical protein